MQSCFWPVMGSDIGVLVGLMRAFNAEAGYRFDEKVARELAERLVADPALGRAWLIVAGAEPVGYVVLAFGFSFEYRGLDAFVDELYLAPSHRSMGFGRAALEFVESHAAALGVKALHLEVETGNAAGRALYEKRGFRGAGRRLLTKWIVDQ